MIRLLNPHNHSFLSFIVIIVLSLATLSSCQKKVPNQTFYTWQGIGPDKWASVWLINRKIDPKATIRFIPVNENLPTAVAFDIPNSKFVRTNETSALAKLASYYHIQSGVVNDLTQIIHDIEVNFWSGHIHSRSPVIELAYRDLQSTYGREAVASTCYLQFFDNLTKLLADKGSERLSEDAYKQALIPDTRCKTEKAPFAEPDKRKLVKEIEIRELLQKAGNGEKIIYVDAREPNEFDEFHIPGAVNLRLRDVNASVASQFKGADKVIAYCLKDFRGFELARALQQKAGIKNAAIMKPYGIVGWKAVGLPVAGTQALSSSVARSRLQKCIRKPDECLKKPL